MSKNLTRKGLALGTALAFVVTGITGIAPASAAAGDVVSLAPTTGTGYAAFDTDYLSVTAAIDTDVVTAAAYDKLAVELTNADSVDVLVKLSDGLAQGTHTEAAQDICTFTLPVKLYDANGNSNSPSVTAAVNVADSTTGNSDCTDTVGASAAFTVDFSSVSSQDWTKAVIDLTAIEAAASADVSLKAAATTSRAVGVTAWIDTDEDEVREDSDKYPSKTETVTFYDPSAVTVIPRIERFVDSSANVRLNADNDGDLGVSVGFSPALNLDQVDLGNITFTSSAGASGDNFTAAYLKGLTTHSAAGRIFGTIDEGGAGSALDLAAGTAYTVTTTVNSVATTTAGYTVPAQTDTATDITSVGTAAVGDDLNSSQSTTTVGLRSGVKEFTYTNTANAEKAGVATYAVVTATDLATGATLQVGGKTLKEGQAALVPGSTDSSGKFAVTVAASSATTGEDYTVKFYVLKIDGTYSTATAYTATYAAGAPTTATLDADIIAGTTAATKMTVKDQFGKAISVSSAGKALYVKFTATNTTNLKQYVAVAAGSASVSFANYLSKGQSDTVTATVGTGANDTDWASISLSDTVSLYNPENANAVNVASAIADKPITYDAFITGTADAATNVAPADADAFEYAGSVVDASGVGIPGAVVTVSGAGLQFRKDSTGDYYKDSITVAADAAGAFDLQVWAHKISSAGITITTTSGGKSATTKLTTIANGATGGTANVVTAADLVFSWNAPATGVNVDETYIVTAKVADKWGNPVAGANLDFSADGALQVNSLDAVNNKITNASGVVRVYIRSLTKTLGVGTVTATLDEVTIAGTALTDLDVASTSAEEDVLTADLQVFKAPTAVITKAANSSAVVKNVLGRTVKIVRGTKSTTKTPSTSTYKITVKGGKGTVKVYVDGVLVASK